MKGIKKYLNMEWTTRDGRILKLKDMSMQHLCNARNMLIRNARYYESNGLSAICYEGGDMAEYYAHQEGDEMLEVAAELRDTAEILTKVIDYRASKGESRPLYV